MAPQNQQQDQAAATIRLPDFYSNSPQLWFDCMDVMFAAAKITQPLTKFHWVLAKLPFSLIATVRPLSRDPSAFSDPYKELQEILLRSDGLSAAQMMSRWLDYPMCGNTRPSVMWDNLTALQPSTVKEAQTIRKLLCHIRNLINPRVFKEPEDLIQRCNKIWEDQTVEEAAAAAAAAAPRTYSPFRGARRSPSPFRGKGSVGDKSGRCRSPTPGPSRGGRNDHLCFYHSRFGSQAQKCEKGCSYQEN
jgi:hypothetical protein